MIIKIGKDGTVTNLYLVNKETMEIIDPVTIPFCPICHKSINLCECKDEKHK